MQLRKRYSEESILTCVKTPNEIRDIEQNVFFYTTLHDLKSPLNNIEGLTHLLRNELSADQRNEINAILDKLDKCVAITQSKIKELTVSANLKEEPYSDFQKVKFEELLDEVIAENEMAVTATHTRIEHSFDIPQIEYSRAALKSVLLNLISNAIKYCSSERESTIHIGTKKRNGKVLLKVTDNGLGIDLSQKKNKIFKLFKRVHHHVEGTGLGLYLVKKIVERAGGRIAVKSKLNEGTSFEVTF